MKKIISKFKKIKEIKFKFGKVHIILLILAGVLVLTGVVLKFKDDLFWMSKAKLSERVIQFVDANFLQGQATSTIDKIEKESGLYKIGLKVGEENFVLFTTKDGRYIIPEAYDMEAFIDGLAKANKEIPKTEKPNVKLFVMSYCPYGNEAEDAIIPVAKLLADKADFEMHYVIYSDYGDEDGSSCLNKDRKYCSMHGAEELKQNVREMCVQKYNKSKLFDFIAEINTNTTTENVSEKWEGIANSLGIDTAKIKSCESDEAEKLLSAEVKLNKLFEIQGSPVLLINDTEYAKDRSAEAYKTAICGAMKTTAEQCSTALATSTEASAASCEN